MANKRTFTMEIVDSDAFLDMPLSTQCLYFHLNMRADDDGFVGNPKRITRLINAGDDDLKLLIAKSFILAFKNGVIVIKHWRMHNTLSRNRYHETQYTDEKSLMRLQCNGSYSLEDGEKIDDGKLIGSSKRQTDSRSIEDAQKMGADSGLDQSPGKKYPCSFEEFWKIYPRKKDKGNAYKKYKARLGAGFTEQELLEAARNYAGECAKNQTEEKYIKYASTFLSDSTPFIDYLDKNFKGGGKDGCTGENDTGGKKPGYDARYDATWLARAVNTKSEEEARQILKERH